MRLPSREMIGRFAGLLIISLFAIMVMLASGTKWFSQGKDNKTNPSQESSENEAPTSVMVQPLQSELINIARTYSGMLEPFEQHTISFEISGRIESLGSADSPFDEGDEVEEGEILATLDQTLLASQKKMAASRQEEASANLQRSRNLLALQPGSVSETEMQRLVTTFEVAKAENDIAEKRLEDATIRSPCKGVISRRFVNVGESINMHAPVFEIVEIDQVLLVVGVPQSQVQEIDARRRIVEQNRNASHSLSTPTPSSQEEIDLRMLAQIEWIRMNPYLELSATTEGEIYRISERAGSDGLFQVEILIPNEGHLLRPGQIGRASIVIDRIEGYRFPTATAIHRRNQAYLFTIKGEEGAKVEGSVEDLLTPEGEEAKLRARRIPISRWIEQGEDIVIPATVIDAIPDCHFVIVRGQHRVVDGSLLNIVPLSEANQEEGALLIGGR